MRLHDNPIFHWDKTSCEGTQIEFVPVFCFDPRLYSDFNSTYQTRKAGIRRTKFDIESIKALRENLQEIGSCLLVVNATPEQFLPQLIDPN
jgi:deoxyribodipyrimidine photolyase